jgi:hypothetical protein
VAPTYAAAASDVIMRLAAGDDRTFEAELHRVLAKCF